MQIRWAVTPILVPLLSCLLAACVVTKKSQPFVPGPTHGCARDADCKGDRVCRKGTCRTAPMAAEDLAQLEGGALTVAALRTVLRAKWCGNPSTREPDGCTTDANCGGNRICYHHRCTASWNVPPVCACPSVPAMTAAATPAPSSPAPRTIHGTVVSAPPLGVAVISSAVLPASSKGMPADASPSARSHTVAPRSTLFLQGSVQSMTPRVSYATQRSSWAGS